MENMLPKIKENEFTFSIVMAVYNTAPYLREAVESILCQDIGFREHVQLILVDDGSTDGSGDIIDEYSSKLPENIIGIHKINSGVSSARNEGMKYVKGKYINFMDADDKISVDVLSKVKKIFSQHENEMDVVSVPLYFFDAMSGEHPLNYIYKKGNRVIDLIKEYDTIQTHVNSSYIRKDALENIKFDSHLCIAEDAKFCMTVLMGKEKLGVVSDVKYFYRKRHKGEKSATQMGGKIREFYLPVIKYYYFDIFRLALLRKGRIPRYVQAAMLYDMTWKMNTPHDDIISVLNEDELKDFRNLFYTLLQKCDDDVIFSTKNIWVEHKLFLLSKKYNTPLFLSAMNNDMGVKLCNKVYFKISQCKVEYEFMKIQDDTLYIYGHVYFLGVQEDTDIQAYLQINGDNLVECMVRYDAEKDKECLGEHIYPAYEFRAKVDNISRFGKFKCKLFTKAHSVLIERKDHRVMRYFPIRKTDGTDCKLMSGWLVKMNGTEFIFEPVAITDNSLDQFTEGKQKAENKNSGDRKVIACSKEKALTKQIIRVIGDIDRCGWNGLRKDKMRVAFIAYRVSIWDKCRPLYEEMSRRDDIEACILVVPNNDDSIQPPPCVYGEEYEYFHEKYSDCEIIDAVDEDGQVIPIEAYQFDYVFYPMPYEAILPSELQCIHVSQFAKTCYIPYGYKNLALTNDVDMHYVQFFASLSYIFTSSKYEERFFHETYPEKEEEGIVFCGYPSLEKFCRGNAAKPKKKSKWRMLWTPRWTYDTRKGNGGSHFLEYKESFLDLKARYTNLELTIRPHPLMAHELTSKGLIKEDELESYWQRLRDDNVSLDKHALIDETFEETDILLTDSSSIIMMYFLTGNPIIYCPSLALVEDYKLMGEGMYIADTWEDVERYVEMLLRGEDPLRQKRDRLIAHFKEGHLGASNRIIDVLQDDWRKSSRMQ